MFGDSPRIILDALIAADKLKSIDFGTVVDCLGEGQIEGSATASKAGITDKTSAAYKNAFLKDLFLNKTAVLQADADNTNPDTSEFNYPSDQLRFEFQDGTANNTVLFAAEQQSSEVITGDKGQECSFPVGGSATARSGTISNTSIDTVQVKIKFDQFFKLNTETGNRESTSVQVIIKVNPNNGSAITVFDETITGKSFNPYNRDYGIDLRDLTGYNTNTSGASGSFFPIVVSAERGNDVGDENTFNTMRLGEIRQIIREPNNYPNIAYSALRFSSELFQNTPARFFRVRGKLVKIPHNATVDLTNGRLTYSGTFNGTFKTDKAWTSDPAWVLYDLLTDTTSGCGLPESELDPFTFYGVSTYCSALVDDGDGGQEPRFSINVNINNRRDAMRVIRDICSVMRAIPYYEEGTIKIAQDAPKDQANPSDLSFDYVFNNANVIDGDFLYSGTSSKTRFNVINVSYFDLETQEVDYVTVKDSTAQSKYGTQTKTINTFGTTSRGMAQRVGKWFLQTQQDQTETVNFETNIAAGSVLRIGDIIGIADRVKSSTRRGGLVKAATVSQITLDDSSATNLPDISDSPQISCMLSDGSVETKSISSYSGGGLINVSSNFTSAPVENSPYILESGEIAVQAYRIINIKENLKKTYTISAVNFNEGKYATVEDGEQLPVKNINILTSLLPSPSIINGSDGTKAIQEIIVLNNNRPVPKLFIDWQSIEGASGYQLIYTKDDENPVVVNTQESEFEILPSESGTYKIQIYTINSNGERSASPTEATIDTLGLTAVPENPTGFEIEPFNNSQVRLTWTKTTSLDVEFGGACEIRHSPNSLSTATFANSTPLNENINGATNEVILPALSGTYSLKFKDLGGRLSATEAKVELSLPEMVDELLVKSQREQTSFSGTKTNLSVSSGALQLTNPASNLTGSYQFASVLDFDAVYQNIRLKRHIKSEGFFVSDQFDSIPDLDSRLNFDGAGSDRLRSKLQVQTSQDNSSFTTEQNLTNGSFSARAFKFIGNIISVDVNENIKLTELGFDAFLPSRTENKYQSGGNIISTPLQSGTSSSGLAVVFGKPFFTGTSDIGGSTTAFLPSISISPENAPSGAFYELSAISRTGFTIVFKNSSSTVIDVKFTFQALGYGKGA
jgi:predicted phage tail protein